MRRRLIATALSVTCLLLIPFAAEAQTKTYRGTFQTVRRLIVRIENRSANFSNSLQNWASRNPNATYSPAAGEDINVFVSDFDGSVRRLRDRFDARQATDSDVQDVLNRAARIDVFLGRHTTNAQTRNQWTLLRSDLNQLATAFNVRWPRVGTTYPPNNTYPPYDNTQGQFRTSLTGTYRVDVSRSDNARDAAERATRNLSLSQRQRVLDAVTQRLEAPN